MDLGKTFCSDQPIEFTSSQFMTIDVYGFTAGAYGGGVVFQTTASGNISALSDGDFLVFAPNGQWNIQGKSGSLVAQGTLDVTAIGGNITFTGNRDITTTAQNPDGTSCSIDRSATSTGATFATASTRAYAMDPGGTAQIDANANAHTTLGTAYSRCGAFGGPGSQAAVFVESSIGIASVSADMDAAEGVVRISTRVGVGVPIERLVIDSTGRVAVGSAMPHARRVFDVASTVYGSSPYPRMTTAEENAYALTLDATDVGVGVYNVTLQQVRWWSWNVTLAAGTFSNGQVKATFAAGASLLNAAAQYVPPGSGASTDLAVYQGGVIQYAGSVHEIVVAFKGNAANVALQTVALTVERSTDHGATWTAIPGATSGPLSAAAGVHHAEVAFTSVLVGKGDILRGALTPSALLTAAVTDITMSIV